MNAHFRESTRRSAASSLKKTLPRVLPSDVCKTNADDHSAKRPACKLCVTVGTTVFKEHVSGSTIGPSALRPPTLEDLAQSKRQTLRG